VSVAPGEGNGIRAAAARATPIVGDAQRGAVALAEIVRALQTTVSPQTARSVQATENLVRSVAAEFGLLSATQVGQRLGSSSEDPSSLAHKRHRAGHLLAVRRGRRKMFPAFQFDPEGSPIPVVRILRALSSERGWSESDLFLWLVTPTGRLGGARPVAMIASPEAAETVIDAARSEMLTQW
jgi:hypothetical protein